MIHSRFHLTKCSFFLRRPLQSQIHDKCGCGQGSSTPRPNPRPTPRPTARPTARPTRHPTPRPSPRPTPRPTRRPTPRPTPRPTARPTRPPTPQPTRTQTLKPTHQYERKRPDQTDKNDLRLPRRPAWNSNWLNGHGHRRGLKEEQTSETPELVEN